MNPEESLVLHRDLHRRYPEITHGIGIDLFDRTGKRYLDGSSGALVANLGHGRADIAAAMAEQAREVAYAHTLTFTTRALEDMAWIVNELLADQFRWYTYPTSGGSEAIETAVKLARHVQMLRGQPGRHRILSFRPSYHGNSLGALAVSGDPVRKRPYEPLLSPSFVHTPPISEECAGVGLDGCCPCLANVSATLQESGPDSFAAVILEPVTGSSRSGFVPHAGFFQGLVDLAHKTGLLVLAAEVMTGFGRTGRMLGSDHHGLRPDMFTAAKGLSGGYAPMGAVVVGEPLYRELQDAPAPFLNGFTYSGNPVSVRVAGKALQILRDEHLVERSRAMGERLAAGLQDLQQRYAIIRRIRGRGLMQGLLLEGRPGLAARIVQRALDTGLILYLGHGEAEGGDAEHILIGPPLVIDEAGLDRLLALLGGALRFVQTY